MVYFLVIAACFGLFVGFVCWQLSCGIRADSWTYDLENLWAGYDARRLGRGKG